MERRVQRPLLRPVMKKHEAIRKSLERELALVDGLVLFHHWARLRRATRPDG
jgi:hypothetical protein